MEFSFDVNYVLPYEITILNGDYRVLNQGQITRIHSPEKLTSIIDAIGQASFKAQGLAGAVTTARKFRVSEHRLYIIKEANDNNNLGAVIGLLKVGEKHLYIYDSQGRVHERTPLCVLDFYVHESKQRLGYGKRLFDTMLQYEKCAPYDLAIDRPSNKCVAFLQKHYNLTSPIHQVNNFVVYPAFFNRSPTLTSKSPTQHQQNSEPFSWLLTSERQARRPYSEVIEVNRNQNLNSLSNENDIFGHHHHHHHHHHQQPSTSSRTFSVRDDRPPHSSFVTSYGQHYNQTALMREQTNTIPSALFSPRTYSQIFNKNNPIPSFQRDNSNSLISVTHSINDNRRRVESVLPPISKPETMTSIFTFPSMIQTPNNWRRQQSNMDTSTWRLFGVQ